MVCPCRLIIVAEFAITITFILVHLLLLLVVRRHFLALPVVIVRRRVFIFIVVFSFLKCLVVFVISFNFLLMMRLIRLVKCILILLFRGRGLLNLRHIVVA